jgi:AraC-like DNA-binding protein
MLGWLAAGLFLLDINDTVAQLYVASLPFVFFSLLPTLYRYQGVMIAEPIKPFSKEETKHLIAPGIALLLSFSIVLMPSDDFTALFFTDSGIPSLWSQINAVGFGVMVIAWLLLSSLYIFHMVKRSRTYHARLKTAFADHANKQLHWFNFFLGWLLVSWVYSCVVLAFDNSLSTYFISEVGVSVFVLGLIWIFCLHAMQRQPVLVEQDAYESEKYERSGIDEERLKRIADKIKFAIITEKAYLDPDINAAKLSDAIGVSTYYLSQTFSQTMNTTFYDYINTARIEAAKETLIQTDKTVLDVAVSVGFNTRSSFYNAFKKNTGVTPSTYRNRR